MTDRTTSAIAAPRTPEADYGLTEAILTHVRPGMHLHFASTPSRSNAAIREVARRFRGTNPRFVLSSTGFHSQAHLLAMLRLGRRYIGSFFGDNYPIPRPNRLYDDLWAAGELEVWSLGTLVAALRAGAQGVPWAVTRSLVGSSLGEDLMRAGRFREVADPEGGVVGLISALRPDITFVHGLVGDTEGRVLFAGPDCEGMWGALAARQGVIATVERIVDPDFCRRFPGAIALPAHRVLAVCAEPAGAHPQPLPPLPEAELPGYRDDFAHYQLWREMSEDPAAFSEYVRQVLEVPDGGRGYRGFVGGARLAALSAPVAAVPQMISDSAADEADVARLVLAGRWIAQRVREENYPVILAGIGQSFIASRLAALELAREGRSVPVMVETGLYDIETGAAGHPFLLSYDNLSRAARLSSVEDVLLTLTCGAQNRCLGVIGGAQIDAWGNINSTWLRSGRFLVGSGGANDIASAAAEVVAITPLSGGRLVGAVDHVTSPGHRLSSIVTEGGVLARPDADHPRWQVRSLYPGEYLGHAPRGETPTAAYARVRSRIPWPDVSLAADSFVAPASLEERGLLRSLDPEGIHWRRAAPAHAAEPLRKKA